jgi:exopolysaccharide biosynthesis polyprenyl glycosylphosphotransferase
VGEERLDAVARPAVPRPLVPEARGAGDGANRAADGSLAAKLRAVQDSSETLEAHRRFELDAERGSSRDPSQWVARQRVRPPWMRPFTAIVVGGDLLVAVSSGAAGIALFGEGESSWAAVPFALLYVAAATLAGVYQHRYVGTGTAEFRRLATAAVVVLAICATAAYALRIEARGLVLAAPVLAGVLTEGWHTGARQALYALRRNGRCTHRVVVVGLERSVDQLVQRLGRQADGGVRVVAACVRRGAGDRIADVPIAGTPDEARSVVRRHRAHAIMLTAWSEVSEEDLRRLSWEIEGSGIQLFVAPRVTEVAVPRLHLQTIGGVPLLHIDEPEFRGLRRVAKGLLDVGLASLALVVLSPLMLGVAIAVRLSSPGPVFFRQERVGRRSRPFRMTKFRSMYSDAEARLAEVTDRNQHGEGPLFKMRDDPRITPVGAFLRKFSLDELPQLFDVLRRDMSLVGPRPPLPREVAAYERDVHRRLLVKPGITGLWQVSGRADLSWEESVRLDLSYVENWSLGLDLSIIVRTVVAVLARRGAY